MMMFPRDFVRNESREKTELHEFAGSISGEDYGGVYTKSGVYRIG